MIKTLRQAVFLRLTLFFVLGILIQTQINLFPYWIYVIVFSSAILSISLLPKVASSYRWRWLFGAGLLLFCFSGAGILTHSTKKQSDWRFAKTRFEKTETMKCRRILLNRLKTILPDEKSFSVAATIAFGYSDDLDKDTRQTFAAAGTAHILAIGGLHFAIIYSMLNFLLSFLGNNRRERIVRQLIIIPLLWAFAFLTGMPVTVIRAVIMITVWGIGNAFSFRALTVNTVGAAAFFMLLYNPFWVFAVGFQLSFFAVFAILLINPYLISLYRSRNPMINYVWELSCTSASAQLGTAPLSMYYFHQFPLLFLVSNIFAIPLTGIILLLIPLSLLVSFIFGNQPGLMFPLQKLLQLFINGLDMLAKIPNGVVTNIQLTVIDVISLTSGIIFSLLLVIKRRLIYLCLLIILVILQVLCQ
jgi:competence protein ComEC